MTTPKETIREILDVLDITDDTNWTDDGAPALDVLQKLANDETITREQVNDANPGFVRQVAGDKPKAAKSAQPKVKSIVDRKFSDDEMREILNRRVRDAEDSLLAAQKAQSEATMEVARCTQRLARAHVDHEAQFPKITPAQNIKAHLAAQIKQSQLRAGIVAEAPVDPASLRPQIDITMERSDRRGTGQTRPTRPVNNVAA